MGQHLQVAAPSSLVQVASHSSLCMGEIPLLHRTLSQFLTVALLLSRTMMTCLSMIDDCSGYGFVLLQLSGKLARSLPLATDSEMWWVRPCCQVLQVYCYNVFEVVPSELRV